jgi:1,4-alpha-glucan branching enzyme
MRRGWKVTDHIHSTSTEHWHPTEAGQECEWNHDRSLDWHLLGDPTHRDLQRLVRDLNALYRGVPALHELDCEREGFAWIDGRNASDSVLAYLRKGRRPTSTVLVVCNFTPVVRHHYRIGAPLGGRWIERINTDAAIYGGSNVGNKGAVEAQQVHHHGQPYSVRLTLPPLAALVFVHEGRRGEQG